MVNLVLAWGAAMIRKTKREYVEKPVGTVIHVFNHCAGKSRCGNVRFFDTRPLNPENKYSLCHPCREDLV